MTPSPGSRTTFAALTLTLCLSLIGCSSTGSASTGAANGQTDPTAAAATPTPGNTSSAGDGGTVPVASGAACDAVPALDVINAQLDEPVTGLRELPRGPGEDVCEAAGDGVANVQFSRLAPSDRAQLEKIAGTLGYSVTELNDPAVPGALTYAGAVTIFVGEVEYTVQTVTMDTIGDPTAPLTAQRSAALLAAWLRNLGVTL